jgi:hypothetical protein
MPNTVASPSPVPCAPLVLKNARRFCPGPRDRRELSELA